MTIQHPNGLCVCCQSDTINTYAHTVSVCKGCFESGIFSQVYPDLIRLIREKILKEEGYEAPRYRNNGLFDNAAAFIRQGRKPSYW